MKSFSVAVFFIGFIALAQCYTEEQIAMYNELSNGCIEATGVSADLVQECEKKEEFSSEPKYKEYIFCMLKTPGFIDDSGDFHIDAIREMVTQETTADLAAAVVDKCTKFTGDKLEKAMEFGKCIHSLAHHLS